MMRFLNLSNSDSKLVKNARAGNLDRVRDLLRKGVNVNVKNKYGEVALVSANIDGHVDVICALLNGEGVDVNTKDAHGVTALFVASEKGHFEVVHALLKHEGIDANIKDDDGNTALIMASWNGHLEVVRVLLNHEGVDANIKDIHGCTALYYASEFGHSEVVHALLKHEGVDANIKDDNGSTAISMASEKGHLEVVHALINHKGVDVNTRDNYGYTALDLARMNSKGCVARLLEEYMEHENLLVENNPAGSGSKLRVTRYPPRRNVNGASSDNAKIEQVKSKCAEPVEYSLEYISQYLASEKREKRIAEEHAMEVKRRRQEWLNRSAGSGAVQQLTADPRRQTKIPSKR
jgi:ankyrin repeat protein